jgi:hypothetical protein
MRKMRLLTLLLVIGLLLSLAPSALSQGGPESIPYDTGHRVTGEFLDQYLSVPNPELVYGNPITESYQDARTNRLIQYFEKARFEYLPELPPGRRIIVTALGQSAYASGVGIPVRSTDGLCRSFSTGFMVCSRFLEFFEAQGGVLALGEPISNVEQRDGLYVQFFTYARLEWRPDLPPALRVKVSDLGRWYFNFQHENPQLLLPVFDAGVQGLLNATVRAFPARPVVGQVSYQTIYITAQTQRLEAVENANVSVVVTLPSGEVMSVPSIPPTDVNGHTKVTFRFYSKQVGLATVRVTLSKSGQTFATLTSFRIWW